MKATSLALLLSLGVAAPAWAVRQQAPKRGGSKLLKEPKRDGSHEKMVASFLRSMKQETLDEGAAAHFNLIPRGGITHKIVVTASYDQNRAEEILVSGVKDGLYKATFLGTVSAHDFGEPGTAQFKRDVGARVKADKVRVSYDYGPGSPRVMIAEKPSDVVTRLDLEIPLNPVKSGITRILYDRVDRSSGYVAGNAEAYLEGRVEIIRQK